MPITTATERLAEPAPGRRVVMRRSDGSRRPNTGPAVAGTKETEMNSIIYLVGLVVVVLAVLSFVGLA